MNLHEVGTVLIDNADCT